MSAPEVSVLSPLPSLHARHSSWDIVRQVASRSRPRASSGERPPLKRPRPGDWTVLDVLCQLFPRYYAPIRKRALLIGIAYHDRSGDIEPLFGTHEDVDCLYDLLIEHYGFQPSNITVMKDADDIEEGLWPNETNIRKQLKALTQDCAPRDRFFFSYAGHAEQKKERVKGSEEDGMDEFIVPYDADLSGARCIIDDDLRKYLVDPLKSRCKLVAVMDACHSATLLDLAHERCIETDGWKGLVTTVARWVWETVATAMGIPLPDPEVPEEARQRKRQEMQNTVSQTLIPFIEKLLGPWRSCWGFCRRAIWPHEPYVLCFSACRDGDTTFEKRGFSMTKVLAAQLRNDPRPRLGKLTANVRSDFTAVYEAKREKYETYLDRNVRRKHTLGMAYWILPESLRGIETPPEMLPPPLAKLQLTSNLPRYTNLERFWI
ncbi:caspase domain-containing protein [Schizophyllum fasciatum]